MYDFLGFKHAQSSPFPWKARPPNKISNAALPLSLQVFVVLADLLASKVLPFFQPSSLPNGKICKSHLVALKGLP